MTDASSPSSLDWSRRCDLRFEVIPTPTVRQRVHLIPAQTPITISASPTRGIEPTIVLAEALRRDGRDVIPHLAARSFESVRHLDDVVDRLAASGVGDVFVVAGDNPVAAGNLHDSLGVLEHLESRSDLGLRIGVAGYPDYHPRLDAESLMGHLLDKQRFASYVVTQLCFDPAKLWDWLAAAGARGMHLPVRIAIAGPVKLARLVAVSLKIGVGPSLAFLQNNSGAASLLAPWRRYDPDKLLAGLQAAPSGDVEQVEGLHLCTFNDLRSASDWHRARCPQP